MSGLPYGADKTSQLFLPTRFPFRTSGADPLEPTLSISSFKMLPYRKKSIIDAQRWTPASNPNDPRRSWRCDLCATMVTCPRTSESLLLCPKKCTTCLQSMQRQLLSISLSGGVESKQDEGGYWLISLTAASTFDFMLGYMPKRLWSHMKGCTVVSKPPSVLQNARNWRCEDVLTASQVSQYATITWKRSR